MFCPWCSNPEGMKINDSCTVTSTDDVIKEILSCRPMFFDGGGVTFTGGEATLQMDAIREIMAKVKKDGVSTAIETNASVKGIEALLDVCDYFMIDFKHPSRERLSSITGGNVDIIKENILKLSKKAHIHIRIPLIGGFNDNDEALDGFTEFFSTHKRSNACFDIELLPYHEYGKVKWEKIGRRYTVKDGFVSKDLVDKFKQAFKNNGFTIINT
jgi:pyruvate formate lyase activating enzyme